MERRDFFVRAGLGAVVLAGLGSRGLGATSGTSTREFLKKAVLRRRDVDLFLDPDPSEPQWACFDPELGYRMRSSVVKDGLDGALTFANYSPSGERKLVNWADERCRINTYGNSFTQCQQVSDGETWQEYLAAHLGEPVRNFGIGGYGVYQAYRRMLREEATANGAEYLILNIYDDDHYRSLMSWRWPFCGSWRDQLAKNDGKSLREISFGMFHANPWAHVGIDPSTGEIVERENRYPTPESLYKLCDIDHVVEAFEDDFSVQMHMALTNGRFDHPENMDRLRLILGVDGDIGNPEECKRVAAEMYLKCAFRASEYIVKKASDFAAAHGKKLMILLSYSGGKVSSACRDEPSFDGEFVDFLEESGLAYVDTLAGHVEDYKSFRLTPGEYVGRYYVGHYNPRGNHFFAFAVKEAVVEWLNPKPPAYA